MSRAQPAMPAGQVARYTLVSVAPNVADMVASAGGLLCDRAMAGWTVIAVVDERTDPTPLMILGADISHGDASAAVFTAAETVVVTPDSLRGGRPGRKDPLAAFLFHGSELMTCATNDHSTYDLLTYRLSAAAHAFKAHAQVALDHAATPGDTETFVGSLAMVRPGAEIHRWACAPQRSRCDPHRPPDRRRLVSAIR